MRHISAAWAFVGLLLGCCALHADAPSVLGTWSDPTGSVLRIALCGSDVCARIIQVSPKAPVSVDVQNPNPSLRTRPLCGLLIGQGFHLKDPAHADGGQLYDPESGQTYHGTVTRAGDVLNLRGYIGIKLFGRTEVWQRAAEPAHPCEASR